MREQEQESENIKKYAVPAGIVRRPPSVPYIDFQLVRGAKSRLTGAVSVVLITLLWSLCVVLNLC